VSVEKTFPRTTESIMTYYINKQRRIVIEVIDKYGGT